MENEWFYMWQMYVFDTTMTNPRSNNVFLKIVRFSVCRAQLVLAFFRTILQLCGRFLVTRYKLCLCLQKRCKIDIIETIKTTFWYEFAKTRKIERHEKKWQFMEKWGNENYGNMMKQYYLNETTETIWTKNNRQREWNHSLFYCVSCVSRGSQPLGSHSEDCTM